MEQDLLKLKDADEAELRNLDNQVLNIKLEMANVVATYELRKNALLSKLSELNEQYMSKVNAVAKEKELDNQKYGFDPALFAFFELSERK